MVKEFRALNYTELGIVYISTSTCPLLCSSLSPLTLLVRGAGFRTAVRRWSRFEGNSSTVGRFSVFTRITQSVMRWSRTAAPIIESESSQTKITETAWRFSEKYDIAWWGLHRMTEWPLSSTVETRSSSSSPDAVWPPSAHLPLCKLEAGLCEATSSHI